MKTTLNGKSTEINGATLVVLIPIVLALIALGIALGAWSVMLGAGILYASDVTGGTLSFWDSAAFYAVTMWVFGGIRAATSSNKS